MEGKMALRRRSGVFLVTAALAVAGCGGDDEADTAPSGGSGSSDTSEPASDSSSVVADAQALIDEAKAPLKFEAPGPEIDASKVKGSSVVILGVDMRIPAISSTVKAAEEAAKAAGLQSRTIDTASDPSKMLQGVKQGVQTAKGIVLVGVSQPLVAEPLKEAVAKKIPAVSAIVSEPLPDDPGQGAGEDIFANSSQSNVKAGELMAAKAVVDTEAKAKVGIFTTEEITANEFVVQGIKSVLDKCPDCEVTAEEDTPLAEWSTGLTSKVESVLRREADLNYLLPIFDAMALFTVPAVQSAGKAETVKVASFNGTPAALKIVQDGGPLTADPGQPYGWAGWLAIDQTMRGMLGEEPANPEVPVRYFDEETLQGVDVENEDEVYGEPGFREGFTQLWGLG
jgi:ribose transport system substrate-binding protein